MVKNISESILDMSDLITVSCPECCKGLFTFSRNILENKGGIQFSCSNCGSLVKACYTEPEHEIFVQCL